MLDIYIIYDLRSTFVVKKQTVLAGGIVRDDPTVTRVPSLDDARKQVPPGLIRFDRDPSDDPSIVETWL